MLIDFTVENYRSIKEPVTLSAVAQAKTGRGNGDAKRKSITPDDEIAPPFLVPNRKLELLPVLGIFGANASGKSNVIHSFNNFLSLISYTKPEGQNFFALFMPFMLGELSVDAPTKFALRTAIDGDIFTYSISIDRKRVLSEKLDYIPLSSNRALNRTIFHRTWNVEQQESSWKNGSEIGHDYKAIQRTLNSDAPFITFLLNSVTVPVIEKWSEWFKNRTYGWLPGYEDSEFDLAASLIGTLRKDLIEPITLLLKNFDTNVDSIRLVRSDSVSSKRPTMPNFKVQVGHKTSTGLLYWDIDFESTGTQRLFALAYKMLCSLETGTMFLADELGSNIHPNITRAIVRLFQNPETNPKRAQLIFTSHDNTLQRGSLLRRDQIWFTQKRSDGSTDLYPLTDFHPRNDLALDKAYLDGRFGAVPLLPPDEELLAAPAGARGAD